jgi:hypothetical protein
MLMEETNRTITMDLLSLFIMGNLQLWRGMRELSSGCSTAERLRTTLDDLIVGLVVLFNFNLIFIKFHTNIIVTLPF